VSTQLFVHIIFGRLAVASEDTLEADVDASDDANEALDLERSTSSDLVDKENGVLDNAETNETVDVATDATTDIDVVLAALGAVRDTVIDLAVAETEEAGDALDEVNNSVDETASDAARANSISVLVGVEEGDGISAALEVETGKTTTDSLEAGAQLALDVDGSTAIESNLGANGERSKEDSVLEAGLAVGVLGIVLDDLVGRSSTVSAELDVNTGAGVDTGAGLGPAAGSLLTSALLGLAIPGLARRA
jgi:hypothetical protein